MSTVTLTATTNERTFCITINEAEAYVLMEILGQCTGRAKHSLFDVYSVLDDLAPRNVNNLAITMAGRISIKEA